MKNRFQHLFLLLIFLFTNGIAGEKPVVIAHRGASGYLVEHTLPSKALAVAMGADFIEQDVVLSRDNIPIVIHDVILEHVTNVEHIFPDRKRQDGHYYAIDFSLTELKCLSLHERTEKQNKHAAFPDRFPISNDAGFKIATLEEEINFIQGLEKSLGRPIGLYTELKLPEFHQREGYDLAQTVLQLLARYGYKNQNDRIYIQCFNFDTLKYVKNNLKSQLKLIQLIGSTPEYDNMVTEKSLEQSAKICSGIGPSLKRLYYNDNGQLQYTKLVQMAHKYGLVVHPYTIRLEEKPEFISSMEVWYRILFEQLKVDGVFTDFTDNTVTFLQK